MIEAPIITDNSYRKHTAIKGVPRKPRPILPERCVMNVSDLADSFTIDRSYEAEKKSKIWGQTDEAVLRYRTPKFRFSEKFEIFYGTTFQ